ncbi:MAG: TAXI family TRAP transporter solute-binding subunit [Oceanospirillaceae bacterium]|nr:TAXI family TRAP transporter solute-binding subunit [Oceanospirillaceae bacterium]
MIRKTVLSLLATAVLASSGAVAETFTIGTNPQGSLAYSIGSAVAKVLTLNTDDRYLVVPRGGPVVTTPLLDKGELDFAISSSMIPAYAREGNALFSDKTYENIRVVANLVPFQSGIFVRADSDIHSLRDLKGRKVPTEFRNQSILRDFLNATLSTADLAETDLDGLPTPNGIRGVQDFMAGKTEAAIFSPGAGIVLQADSAVGGIRYLSIERTAETERHIADLIPGSSIETLQPASTRPGVDHDTNLIAASFLLLSSNRLDDTTAAGVAEVLHTHKDDLVAALGAFRAYDPRQLVRDVRAPYHPGVLAYISRQEQARH